MQGLLAKSSGWSPPRWPSTLGVAFMAGTLVLTDTIGKTFDDLFADVYKGTDAVVRAKAVFDGPQFTGAQRPASTPRWSARLAPGAGRRRGRGQRLRLRPADRQGRQGARQPGRRRADAGRQLEPGDGAQPVAAGGRAAPQAADQVVIDRKSATDGDLGSATRRRCWSRARRSGSGSRGSPVSAPPTARAARPSCCSPPRWRSSWSQRPGSSPASCSPPSRASRSSSWPATSGAALPHGLEAITGAAITEETQDSSQKAMSFFNTFMLIFAVIALLVGAFMIFNTFSITVAQRTRENGLLRALGASKRQMLGSVLLEALAVGVIASASGWRPGSAWPSG